MKLALLLLTSLFSLHLLTACTPAQSAPDAAEPLPYPQERGAAATASKMISPATSYSY